MDTPPKDLSYIKDMGKRKYLFPFADYILN